MKCPGFIGMYGEADTATLAACTPAKEGER